MSQSQALQDIHHRPLRVLHAPTMVGLNPAGLVRVERSMGCESTSVVFGGKVFGQAGETHYNTKGIARIRAEIMRFVWVWRASRHYDIIHFNFGASLMAAPNRHVGKDRGLKAFLRSLQNLWGRFWELRDLGYLKRKGRKIVVTYQGDDARQWDYCREHCEWTHAREAEPVYIRHSQDEGVRYRVARFAKYADLILAVNPDLLAVLPSSSCFFPYAWPDLSNWKFTGVETGTARPLKVLHAPSDPLVKGTKFLEAALETLRAEGIAFEYIRIEGMANAEAKGHYETADLLVDQLLCGWYGALSAELMALGKPVICYLREADFKYLPADIVQNLPILNANPETITNVLRDVLRMSREELREIGIKSRRYIEWLQGDSALAARLEKHYLQLYRKDTTAAVSSSAPQST